VTDAGVVDSGVEPPPGACPAAPKPARPIAISLGAAVSPFSVVGGGPVLASAGCSFAAIWATQGDATEVHAMTLRVVDGAWRASPLISVASTGCYLPSTAIAWNGSAYVLAWNDVSNFNLRVMAEDGTLVGDPVRLFASPPTSDLRGMEASEDGVVRLGLSLDFTLYQPRGSYAKVTVDGRVIVAPTPITPPGQSINGPGAGISFRLTPDGPHEALAVSSEPSSSPSIEQLTSIEFDDEGNVTGTTTLSTRSSANGFLSIGSTALAVLGPEVYGAWSVMDESGTVRASYVDDLDGGTPIRIPESGPPEIVGLGSSTLGVFTTPASSSGHELGLVLVNGATVGPRTTVAASSEIGLGTFVATSAGKETVAVGWATLGAVYFTIVTP
jgi:hypothetical protein